MTRPAWMGLAATLAPIFVLTSCAVSQETPARVTDTQVSPAASQDPIVSTEERATKEPVSVSVPATATMTLSGDLLWHDTVWRTAARDGKRVGKDYDYAPMFAHIAPIISEADLSVCHEEVPFGTPKGPFKSYPVFSVPPQAAAHMATVGFDVCSTASNHSVDAGFDGLKNTLDVLDAHKIDHFGTARTPQERTAPVIREVNGIKIGFVGGTFGTNGMPVKKPWSVQMWDTKQLLDQAQRTRTAGAEFIVVALHGGVEYKTDPTPEQVQRANALTASPDVDLVYGHHAHVVQPWTMINGKHVIYGLGNLINDGIPQEPRVFEGIFARLTLTRADGSVTVSKAEYIPTFGTSSGRGPIRVYAVNKALADGAYKDTKRLQTAKERTAQAVLSMGMKGLVQS